MASALPSSDPSVAAMLEVRPQNLRHKRRGLENFWQRATQGETADESSNKIPHEVLLSKKSWRQMRTPQIVVRPLARAPSVRCVKSVVDTEALTTPPLSPTKPSSSSHDLLSASSVINRTPPRSPTLRPCEIRMTSKKSWRQTIPSRITLRSRSPSSDSRASMSSIEEDPSVKPKRMPSLSPSRDEARPLPSKKSWRPLARMASKKSFRSLRSTLRHVPSKGNLGMNNDRTNAQHVETLQPKPSWRQMHHAAQISIRGLPRTLPSETSHDTYRQTKPSLRVFPGDNNDRTNSQHFASSMQSKRSWRQAYAPHITLRHVGGKKAALDESTASTASSSSSIQNASQQLNPTPAPATRYVKKVEIPTLGSALNRVRVNEGDVKELDFGQLSAKNRKLDSRGGVLVARVLITNRTVKRLIIRDHGIGDQGAIAIANMLRFNSTIEYIDLYGNEITDIGATALADVLYGHDSIVHLSLWSNQITSKGAAAFAEAIKCNRKMKYLGLVHNRITQEGAQALLDALDVNFRLETLDLAKNRIPASLTAKIRVALARNRVEAPNLLSMMAIEEAEVERRLAELGLDDNRDEVTDAVSETTSDTSEVTDDDLSDDDDTDTDGDEVWAFSEDDADLEMVDTTEMDTKLAAIESESETEAEAEAETETAAVAKTGRPLRLEDMIDGVWL